MHRCGGDVLRIRNQGDFNTASVWRNLLFVREDTSQNVKVEEDLKEKE